MSKQYQTDQEVPLPTRPEGSSSKRLRHSWWWLVIITLSLTAVLVLFGVIISRTTTLQHAISPPVDIKEFSDAVGSSKTLLYLPVTAMLIWMLNTSLGLILYQHKESRGATYLLWTTTLVVELAFLPVALHIVDKM